MTKGERIEKAPGHDPKQDTQDVRGTGVSEKAAQSIVNSPSNVKERQKRGVPPKDN